MFESQQKPPAVVAPAPAEAQPIAREGLTPPPKKRRAWAGLLVRRECWSLSGRGRVLLLATVLLLALGAKSLLYSFLAVSEPVESDVMVVEGWIPAFAARQGAILAITGGYRKVYTSGGPVLDQGESSRIVTHAEWGAARLERFGLTNGMVTPIPCLSVERDRTFASALAVKAWFDRHHVQVKSLNLVTLGPHARRSRLMFEQAFDGEVRVGVIALRDEAFDPRHWWRTSEGVREVVGESVAYLYARFFFHASADDRAALLEPVAKSGQVQ